MESILNGDGPDRMSRNVRNSQLLLYCHPIAQSMAAIPQPASTNKKTRIYLTNAEKDLLQQYLPTWSKKDDKRSREAYLLSTVIPGIQEINLQQFSPEIISRDKEAKKLWERRIEVPSAFTSMISSLKHPRLFFRPLGRGSAITSRSRTELSSSWSEKSHSGESSQR
jgi:hypothetical protein